MNEVFFDGMKSSRSKNNIAVFKGLRWNPVKLYVAEWKEMFFLETNWQNLALGEMKKSLDETSPASMYLVSLRLHMYIVIAKQQT